MCAASPASPAAGDFRSANIVMGPPIFAPLLFGVSAYLGLIASFLRPEEAPEIIDITPGRLRGIRRFFFGRSTPWTQEIREGRFQKHLAVATILSAFFSGFEALYSHYKNNFRYKAQWSPIIIAPLLMLAAALSIKSPTRSADGAAGGLRRRHRGWRHRLLLPRARCFPALGRIKEASL